MHLSLKRLQADLVRNTITVGAVSTAHVELRGTQHGIGVPSSSLQVGFVDRFIFLLSRSWWPRGACRLHRTRRAEAHKTASETFASLGLECCVMCFLKTGSSFS